MKPRSASDCRGEACSRFFVLIKTEHVLWDGLAWSRYWNRNLKMQTRLQHVFRRLSSLLRNLSHSVELDIFELVHPAPSPCKGPWNFIVLWNLVSISPSVPSFLPFLSFISLPLIHVPFPFFSLLKPFVPLYEIVPIATGTLCSQYSLFSSPKYISSPTNCFPFPFLDRCCFWTQMGVIVSQYSILFVIISEGEERMHIRRNFPHT
jgi:hypothetical protein